MGGQEREGILEMRTACRVKGQKVQWRDNKGRLPYQRIPKNRLGPDYRQLGKWSQGTWT